MNDSIVRAVRSEMKAQHLTQQQLSARLQVCQPSLSRIFAGRSARVPATWQRILAALKLELVVQPQDSEQG